QAGTPHATSRGDMRHRFHRRTYASASPVSPPPLRKTRRAVTRIVLARISALAASVLIALLDAGSASARDAGAPPLTARHAPAKPPATVLLPGADSTRLLLKFAEGSGVRLRTGRLVSPTGAGLSDVEKVLRDAGIGRSAMRRLFSRPEGELDRDRQIGESRRGRELADLNLYYEIAVPANEPIAALCDALNALPAVW